MFECMRNIGTFHLESEMDFATITVADNFSNKLERLLDFNNTVEVDFKNVIISPHFVHLILKPLIEKYGLFLFKKLFLLNMPQYIEIEVENLLKEYQVISTKTLKENSNDTT